MANTRENILPYQPEYDYIEVQVLYDLMGGGCQYDS